MNILRNVSNENIILRNYIHCTRLLLKISMLWPSAFCQKLMNGRWSPLFVPILNNTDMYLLLKYILHSEATIQRKLCKFFCLLLRHEKRYILNSCLSMCWEIVLCKIFFWMFEMKNLCAISYLSSTYFSLSASVLFSISISPLVDLSISVCLSFLWWFPSRFCLTFLFQNCFFIYIWRSLNLLSDIQSESS